MAQLQWIRKLNSKIIIGNVLVLKLEVKKMSEEFLEAFHSGTAGLIRDCKCRRTHYNDFYENGYEEGELENLREMNAKFPDQYIPHDGDVETINFMGSEIVPDCPCGLENKAERMLLSEKYCITNYFTAISKKKRKEADEFEKLVKEMYKND